MIYKSEERQLQTGVIRRGQDRCAVGRSTCRSGHGAGSEAQHHVLLGAIFSKMTLVSAQPEITQRDLRNRSREIMDAVERGQAFTVTRDGHRIGELIPLRRRRRFVTREEFAAMSRGAPSMDVDAFRADQDAAFRSRSDDAYDR